MVRNGLVVMRGLVNRLRRLGSDRRGVTTLEYGILAAGVAVVIGIILSDDGVFYQTIQTLFDRITDALPTVSSGGK